MPFEWHPNEPPPFIESHSRAKLEVLRTYIRAYFNRLNNNPAREEFKIVLVDGFAGGGTFKDSKDTVSGSPLVMLEESNAAVVRLNQHRAKRLNFDCKYFFVDIEKAHTDHLRKVLAERGYQVDERIIFVRNCSFLDAVDDIISEIHRHQPIAGRAIFLLDQKGFSHVELAIVGRIFRELPAAEVILTFAADALVSYFADTPQIRKTAAKLELTDAQMYDLIELKEGSGGRALIQRELREHIRAITGATFDTPFFIRPRTSHRALWFLHLSRHPTARDVMNRCHWDISNTFEHYGHGDIGMLGYDALRSQEIALFNFNELDFQQLATQLPNSLARELYTLASEHPVTVDTVRYALANETAARFSDIDKAILRLFREKEFEIWTPDNKLRSYKLQQLNRTDRIAIPTQRLLLGLSRRD